MPNLLKEMVTREYQREFSEAGGMLVVSMDKVTVVELEKLRAELAKGGARLRMVRNSLARRVLAERGLEFGDEVLTGNVAIVYGSAEGVIHGAKSLAEPSIKKSGKLGIRAGVLESQVLSAADATALAGVPDKRTLRAQLVGLLASPARGLVTVLAANPSGLARLLQARVDKASEAAAPAPEAG
jgi:large subunit ribosomal protein L10